MGPELALAVTGVALQGATLLKDLIGLVLGYLEADSTFKNLHDTLKSVMEVVAQFKEMLLAPGAEEAFSSKRMKVNFGNFVYQIQSLKNIFDQLGDMIKKFARKAGKLSKKGKIWWVWADLDPARSLTCSILGHIASLSFAVQILEMAKLSSMSSKMDRYHKSSEATADEHAKEIKEDIRMSEQERDKDRKILEEMRTAMLRRGDLDDREVAMKAQEEKLKVTEAEVQELQDELEKLRLLQINGTRHSDIKENPRFKKWLDSIVMDATTSIAAEDQGDVRDEGPGNVVFQAEVDRDALIVAHRKALEDKFWTERRLGLVLMDKTKAEKTIEETEEELHSSKRKALRLRDKLREAQQEKESLKEELSRAAERGGYFERRTYVGSDDSDDSDDSEYSE